MINVVKARPGLIFELHGQPHKVLDFSHTHTGRGGATIKLQIKNLETGTTTSKTFKSGEKLQDLDTEKRKLQFLYRAEGDLIFMDPDTFVQISADESVLGEKAQFLKEGEDVWVLIWNKASEQEIIDVELPAKLEFEIAEAAPSAKGNTAANSYKQAKLENGMAIKVPLFIKAGDVVRVSTEDGSYVERVS
jgi:elongation factor P